MRLLRCSGVSFNLLRCDVFRCGACDAVIAVQQWDQFCYDATRVGVVRSGRGCKLSTIERTGLSPILWSWLQLNFKN